MSFGFLEPEWTIGGGIRRIVFEERMSWVSELESHLSRLIFVEGN